jgi:hypothetical protein
MLTLNSVSDYTRGKSRRTRDLHAGSSFFDEEVLIVYGGACTYGYGNMLEISLERDYVLSAWVCFIQTDHST